MGTVSLSGLLLLALLLSEKKEVPKPPPSSKELIKDPPTVTIVDNSRKAVDNPAALRACLGNGAGI